MKSLTNIKLVGVKPTEPEHLITKQFGQELVDEHADEIVAADEYGAHGIRYNRDTETLQFWDPVQEEWVGNSAGTWFLYEQTELSDEWIVEHGLGSEFPMVTVYIDEKIVIADVTVVDKNVITIKLSTPSTGVAVLRSNIGTETRKTVTVHAILTAADWENSEAPFAQTVAINGMTPDANAEVGLSMTRTSEQYAAVASAMLQATAQGMNSVMFVAEGKKPTVDIPITAVIFGWGEVWQL